MCIFIYKPNHKITLEHVSETLVVEKGTYEIVLDILLQNSADKNLTDFFAIVPHSLFYVKHDKRKLKDITYDTGIFEDITHDFTNRNSHRNDIYKCYPNKLEHHFDDKTNQEIMVITQAKPQEPTENQEFEGILTGNNLLKGVDGFSVDEYKILSRNRITVLSCEFKPELESGAKGWFRWRIVPQSTTLTPKNNLERIINWLRNYIVYNYKIIGPCTVRNKVTEKLHTYRRVLSDSTDPTDLKLASIMVNELIRKLISESLNNADTIIKDWRINLYQKRLRNITIISQEGDIKPCGSQPNHLDTGIGEDSGIYDLAYQWAKICECNETDSKKCKESNDFSIFFRVRFINLFYSLGVVWLGFIFAIIALILSLT